MSFRLRTFYRRVKHLSYSFLIGLDQRYSATTLTRAKQSISIKKWLSAFIYWFSDTGFLSIAVVGVMRKRQIAKQYHDHGAKQLPTLTSNWATGTS